METMGSWCAEAHAPFYPSYQIQSGCTMEFVRPGSQYRQDPLLWNDPLTLERAENTEFCLQLENWVSRLAPGWDTLSP